MEAKPQAPKTKTIALTPNYQMELLKNNKHTILVADKSLQRCFI
jgi:hypothetical protein